MNKWLIVALILLTASTAASLLFLGAQHFGDGDTIQSAEQPPVAGDCQPPEGDEQAEPCESTWAPTREELESWYDKIPATNWAVVNGGVGLAFTSATGIVKLRRALKRKV